MLSPPSVGSPHVSAFCLPILYFQTYAPQISLNHTTDLLKNLYSLPFAYPPKYIHPSHWRLPNALAISHPQTPPQHVSHALVKLSTFSKNIFPPLTFSCTTASSKRTPAIRPQDRCPLPVLISTSHNPLHPTTLYFWYLYESTLQDIYCVLKLIPYLSTALSSVILISQSLLEFCTLWVFNTFVELNKTSEFFQQ